MGVYVCVYIYTHTSIFTNFLAVTMCLPHTQQPYIYTSTNSKLLFLIYIVWGSNERNTRKHAHARMHTRMIRHLAIHFAAYHTDTRIHTRTHMRAHSHAHTNYWPCYGVATISRRLKVIGLFCRILSITQGSFAKETYNFEEPTNRDHPIRAKHTRVRMHTRSHTCTYTCTRTHRHTRTHIHTHTHYYLTFTTAKIALRQIYTITHTRTHTHTHSHLHTHTHTHTSPSSHSHDLFTESHVTVPE